MDDGVRPSMRLIAARSSCSDAAVVCAGGISLGGGVEYFAPDLTSLKGKVRWDSVQQPPGRANASGLTLTLGVKRYF